MKSGISYVQIARMLGRSFSGIRSEVIRAGGRENYNSVSASKTREYRKTLNFENRIRNLEMHMEILTQVIREMTK